MPASAPDPTEAALELARRVRGPVLLPGDEGFAAECAGFQTGVRQEPAVVVGAAQAADVQAAVAFAAARGLPVGVRATGHGLPEAARGGLLIGTRRMDTVRVDPAARTAWFAAGARWERVVPEAARHGLAPLNGSAPQVGAVSYTLGGGLGLLSRQYGYAADHVRSIDLVTADGRLRTVTAAGDPELFWGLRGGAAALGVVTGMEVELFPVERIYGGGLMFDTDLVDDLLETYLRWTETVPEQLTSSLGLVPMPDVPAVPKALRGRFVAHVRIAYTGDPADGERLVAPLRAVGPRLTDRLGDMPYRESGRIYSDPTTPHSYRGDNALLGELDAQRLRTVVELAGPGSALPNVIQVRHLGGALGRPPAEPNAVGHRGARYLLSVLGMPREGGVEELRAVQRRAFEAVAPVTLGRSLNFLYAQGNADRDTTARGSAVRGVYEPADLERLARLKAALDPTDLFRHNYRVIATS
ncbi:FAD-binding oxidoreductase [Streptomyces palmae]|uniref:FAD-binding oxidoreductase n=1 Tax=Streptomyces palmae TaxID=1701085 RepID=A0A4Z0HJJ5_9ACTN|nr:FAD-binding oxidoreductase [Streptomyces palmae]